jgi:predicted O-methyltransferase YrrM
MALIRSRLRRLVTDATQTIIEIGHRGSRDTSNIVLSSLFSNSKSLMEKNDPCAYVDFVRSCIEPVPLKITVVKSEPQHSPGSVHDNLFTSLVETLRWKLLPMPVHAALKIADRADEFLGLSLAKDTEHWSGTVGLHFALASSTGKKGRILSTAIRLCRAKQCLELGTAYGLSAMFILETLRSADGRFHLTTIEGSNPQFTLASKHLTEAYGNAVTCQFGLTQELLPALVKSCAAAAPVEFMFHDAGHSRADYVNDFGAVVSALAPGGLVVFDDINWKPSGRFPQAQGFTHDGWQDVVAHPRVKQAIEINGEMGLLQVN